MKNQKGFGALGALLVVAVLAAIGLAAWYVVDRNRDDKKSATGGNSTQTTNNENNSSPNGQTAVDPATEYVSMKTAITEQSSHCVNKTADFAASPAELKVVAATDAFDSSVNAVMTNDASSARVVFGCKGGSQAEVGVLQKVDSKWKLVAEDASSTMACSKVDGKKIPAAIIEQECYANEQAGTDLRAIRNE